jgi:hypothetical protein
MVLLEKEWISFGHKFKDRLGHLGKNSSTSVSSSKATGGSTNEWKQASKNMFGAASKLFNSIASPGGIGNLSNGNSLASGETITPRNVAPKEISPVFPQFLDCLYQIWKQYPTEFEFDERLLEFLYLSGYSCNFGNFLFNNQQERKTFRTRAAGMLVRTVNEASPSVWQYISSNEHRFLNPLYTPRDQNTVLQPSSSNLVYWSRLYKISQHSFAEDDAILSSNGNLKESLSSGVIMKKEPSLSYLDPTIPIGHLKIGSNPRNDDHETDMVDLQSPMPSSLPASGVVDHPLMNPWS